jgi:hypothetical protein
MSSAFHVLCGAFLLSAIGAAQQLAAPPVDDHVREFRQKLIWKAPLAKTALSALFNEVRNSPHEWGRGADGFAKRAGSAFGQRAVKATVELAASGWTHEDLHYHRSGQGRFWPRVKHAMVSTFWVRRDNGIGNTLAAGRISGAFAAGQVSRTWMPDRVATFGSGMQSFGASLGLDVGTNLFLEFWPRKH